jgi:cell division protein FtsL
MEFVKIAWVIIFLLFALSLLFVWSKVYIVSRKIKAIDDLINRCESLGGVQSGKAESKPAA